MKYSKTVFLLFKGGESDSGVRQSYHHWSDRKLLDRKFTLKFGRERKSLLDSSDIQLVRINFPYTDDYPAIFRGRKNTEVANHLIGEALKTLQPNSRVYIEAHCNSGREAIKQEVLAFDDPRFPNSERELMTPISYRELGDLFAKYVPSYAKFGLNIVLYCCKARHFASCLMGYLHEKGFINSSVTCFNEQTVSVYFGMNSKKDHFTLKDASSLDRSISGPVGVLKPYHHGDKFPDNKLVFFNHASLVQSLPYREFKKAYIRDIETCGMSHIDGFFGHFDLPPEVEEAVIFRQYIFDGAGNYLNECKASRKVSSSDKKFITDFAKNIMELNIGCVTPQISDTVLLSELQLLCSGKAASKKKIAEQTFSFIAEKIYLFFKNNPVVISPQLAALKTDLRVSPGYGAERLPPDLVSRCKNFLEKRP
ncbi:MAG: hypothetical protein GY750_15630 [Lentisphaerae bacterium]|nr:hypothetical protein [Lentisphaerota bacterium]MCP4102828.1 hypothetical protein [Lentisphaerota bacterium]